MMIKHLYLHVPFCMTICSYCDFCHVQKDDGLVEKWLNALKEEIDDKDINPELETIYIGGGTPNCLNDEQLEFLLGLIDPFSSKTIEYTIEVNPELVTNSQITIMKQHGINRISMGVQTTDSKLLALMNRHHTFENVKEAIELFINAGINNISLDLMYSLPGQTVEGFKDTLSKVIELAIAHLSLYSLTIEPNTVFGKKGYEHSDEDTEADMYELAVSYLTSNGYNQYEISNFSKPGYQSKHNIGYWLYDDFYGISMGASGKDGNTRYDNTKSFAKYFEHNYVDTITTLNKKDEMFENLMMSLRMKEGLNLDLFNQRYECSFDSVYGDIKEELIKKGLLIEEDHHLKCTDYGFEICNTVIEYFMN